MAVPVSPLPSLGFITSRMCLIIIRGELLTQPAIQCVPPYDYSSSNLELGLFCTREVWCAICCEQPSKISVPMERPFSQAHNATQNVAGIQTVIVITKQTTSKHWVCITSSYLGPSVNIAAQNESIKKALRWFLFI